MSTDDRKCITEDQTKRRKILAGIMAKAHFNTRFRIASVGMQGKSYAAVFADMLKSAWNDHRRNLEASRSYIIREQLRSEQNTGLPLRSTPIDARRTYHRSSRYVASIGA